MRDAWLWLKEKWIWLLGGIVSFIVWLYFFHDKNVRDRAILEEKKRVLEKRKEQYEKMDRDTQIKEERLEERIDKIDRQLRNLQKDDDADAASDRLRKFYRWGSDKGDSR